MKELLADLYACNVIMVTTSNVAAMQVTMATAKIYHIIHCGTPAVLGTPTL